MRGRTAAATKAQEAAVLEHHAMHRATALVVQEFVAAGRLPHSPIPFHLLPPPPVLPPVLGQRHSKEANRAMNQRSHLAFKAKWAHNIAQMAVHLEDIATMKSRLRDVMTEAEMNTALATKLELARRELADRLRQADAVIAANRLNQKRALNTAAWRRLRQRRAAAGDAGT